MDVVQTGQDDIVVSSREHGRLVCEHIEVEFVESLGHIGGVVITENGDTAIVHSDGLN
ncbi:MAG: hypothetical protein JO058_01570 [Alphaproteobacteria bacterium]|nr:hypothetical protein [Alphaproteobacteria bacterium]